ncbi:hypothetical protein DL96DRAFT_1453736, partial [Flagelloscypha sp. PMI_526]
DVDLQFKFAENQQFDAYANAVAHGEKRKEAFDKKVKSQGGEVVFKEGDLVQSSNPKLKNTHKLKYKLIPRWLGARRVV